MHTAAFARGAYAMHRQDYSRGYSRPKVEQAMVRWFAGLGLRSRRRDVLTYGRLPLDTRSALGFA